ncbi:MAG: response regulator [Verrucomicrobia bacterium]|nr:response regulator [Verrucomicrobiota bacterium]
MAKSLHILIVEDSASDAALVVRQIERAGYEVCWERVDNAAALQAALQKGRWDAVLCDYAMPDFGGAEALAIVRDSGRDLPFIFVSGTMGEDVAVEAMRVGAHDYVMKGNLKRLVPAIERELREAEVRRDRREAEEELRVTHEALRHLLAHSPAVICSQRIDGPDMRIEFVSDNVQRLLGFSAAEVARRGWWLDSLHPEDRARVLAVVREGTRGPGYSAEYRLRHRDGTYRWIKDSNRVVCDAAGQPREAVGVWTEITERKAAEESLRAERQRFAHLFENSPVATWLEDCTALEAWMQQLRAEGVMELRAFLTQHPEQVQHALGLIRVLDVNQAAVTQNAASSKQHLMTSLPGLFPSSSHPVFGEELAAFWSGKTRFEFEIRSARLDGAPLDLIVRVDVPEKDGRPDFSRVIVATTDITERKKIEAQFLRAQRLESIGQLAGGIAHDLNNILAPIMMLTPMLRESIHDPHMLALVQMLETSAKRGASIVKQVLTFSRGIEGRKAPVQTRALFNEIQSIVRETFPRTITIQTRVPADLWLVQADSTQLHQVLMNLCVNARDAMPNGGVLLLDAQNLRLDAESARTFPGAKEGCYVAWRISDTGQGIPQEHLDHIFDPFFTTKEVGKGTGLGLSTVLGIVRDHGGVIDVTSEAGQGTRFTLLLPALQQSAQVPPPTDTTSVPRGHGERVLVVDDEESVRQLVQLALEHHGYQPMIATDGKKAINLYTEYGENIRVLLTDMDMPPPHGQAVIQAARKLHPEVKIICMSGHPRAVQLEPSPAAFLEKPFTASRMLRTLHQVLAQK